MPTKTAAPGRVRLRDLSAKDREIERAFRIQEQIIELFKQYNLLAAKHGGPLVEVPTMEPRYASEQTKFTRAR